MNYLTPAEAAAILSVTPDYLKRLAAQGRIRSYKLGHRTLRFTREDLDAFVEDHSTQPRRRRRRAS